MKLLTRTIRNYLLYSTLLILTCTPLFYFSILKLFNNAMDRELRSHMQDFYKALPYLETDEDQHFYNLMNEEFLLELTNQISKDTLYHQDLYDSASAEYVPHRIFRKGVSIRGQNYNLYIRESTVTSKSLMAAIMGTEFLLLFLLLCGLVLINQKLSKSIWEPFYEIMDRLKKYRIDQDNLKLPTSSTAEFRELAGVITQLINKNHEAYLSQKEFTENAAHELQTPLAICRSKLELLAQTRALTQEQAELIASLLNATDRISRLNKNLLLLSKIENSQFIETEDVGMAALVSKSLAAFKHQASKKKLAIQSHIASIASIKANSALMDILITNLVSNAIRHTPEWGIIIIDCNPNYISICNTGAVLQQPEKLFNRFHRESRTTAGSGLGLSISKKIADVSGFDLSYLYKDNLHQFKVTFNQAIN